MITLHEIAESSKKNYYDLKFIINSRNVKKNSSSKHSRS